MQGRGRRGVALALAAALLLTLTAPTLADTPPVKTAVVSVKKLWIDTYGSYRFRNAGQQYTVLIRTPGNRAPSVKSKDTGVVTTAAPQWHAVSSGYLCKLTAVGQGKTSVRFSDGSSTVSLDVEVPAVNIWTDTPSPYTFKQVGASYTVLIRSTGHVKPSVKSSHTGVFTCEQPVWNEHWQGYLCKLTAKGAGSAKLQIQAGGSTRTQDIKVPAVNIWTDTPSPYTFKQVGASYTVLIRSTGHVKPSVKSSQTGVFTCEQPVWNEHWQGYLCKLTAKGAGSAKLQIQAGGSTRTQDIKVPAVNIWTDTPSPYTFKQVGASYTVLIRSTGHVKPSVKSSQTGVFTCEQPVWNEHWQGYLCKLTAKGAGSAKLQIQAGGSTRTQDIKVPAVNIWTDTPSPFHFKRAGQTYCVLLRTTGNIRPSASSSNAGTVACTPPRWSDAHQGYLCDLTGLTPGTAEIRFTAGGTKKALTVQVPGVQKRYVQVEGTGVRMRSGPSTGDSVVCVLSNGQVLELLDSQNAGWFKVKTTSGKTGYVSSTYLRACSAPGGNSTALNLSHTAVTIPAGKSVYVKASANPASAAISWVTSNASVAMAESENGYCYIRGVKKGSATVTAVSGSMNVQCRVTVTDSVPVRTAYAAPNVVNKGATGVLWAVTDADKRSVSFRMDGKTFAAQYVRTDVTDGVQTKVWKASFSSNGMAAGRHSFTVGSNGATTGFTGAVYVSTQSGNTQTTREERGVSDQGIRFIASKEGFSSAPYLDTLAEPDIPTTGYGVVLHPGDVFFNHMSAAEGHASLVNEVNGSYAAAVNKLCNNYQLHISQSQMDALTSFAYNVGTGYFTNVANGCTFREVMLCAAVPRAGQHEAYAITGVSMRSGASSSSAALLTIPANASVTVTGYRDQAKNGVPHKDLWYQVRYNGRTGWVNAGYLRMRDASACKRDLNYTNADAFTSELDDWCMAGGVRISGLLKRRQQEAAIFNYATYP